MRIGEISSRSQLSRDTIRFYEKRGLIQPKASTSIYNNYKDYTEETLERLQTIKKAKSFGFTLNEVADLLVLLDHNRIDCHLLQNKMVHKIASIDEKIRELTELRSRIQSSFEEAQNSCLRENGAGKCTVFTPSRDQI